MSIYEVKPSTQLKREVVKLIFSPILRSDVTEDPEHDGSSDFEKMLAKGLGGIVFIKHYSFTDPLQVTKDVLMRSNIMKKREWVGVNALHQIYPGEMAVAEMVEMKIYTIVTENTIKRARRKGKPAPKFNEGSEEFIKGAVEKINNGAILVLAPEGERRDNLEPYSKRTVGRFINAAEESGLNLNMDTPCLFADLRLARKQGYWSKSGFNVLDKHEVRIGRAMRLGQILENAGGNWRNVDRMVVLPEMQRTAAIEKPSRGLTLLKTP